MVVQLDYSDVTGQRYNHAACFREQTFNLYSAAYSRAFFCPPFMMKHFAFVYSEPKRGTCRNGGDSGWSRNPFHARATGAPPPAADSAVPVRRFAAAQFDVAGFVLPAHEYAVVLNSCDFGRLR
jgi:hypothetical protein